MINTYFNTNFKYRPALDFFRTMIPTYAHIANLLVREIKPFIDNFKKVQSAKYNFYISTPYTTTRIPAHLSINTSYNVFGSDDKLYYQLTPKIKIGNFVLNNYKCKNNYVVNNYQYISVAKITNYPTMAFESVCCNISGPKYLEQDILKPKTILTLNGSFFDIKSTFRPIGIYKDKQFNPTNEQNSLIPPKYKKYFKLLLVKTDKTIEITDYIDFETRYLANNTIINTYSNVFSFAPLIYDKSKPDQSFSKFPVEVIDLFDCDSTSGLKSKITENLKYNCATILPGELSHGKQANPRSWFVIKGTDLYLLTCEGRGNRGYGMTFADIENISLDLTPDIVGGLDGGRSSHMAFKLKDSSNSYLTNPTYKTFAQDIELPDMQYPVGNILAISE